MIVKVLTVCGALVFATAATAQTATTPPANAPGQKMLDAKKKGTTSTAPGASEYAPGQLKQDETTKTGPGASNYAPGQANKPTTTGSSNSRK
jgi:hypothetical protein